MPLLELLVPTITNFISQGLINKQNQRNYIDAQNRANQFARSEREMAQQYNSLENQYAQMANVGLNPNLMNGQMFQATLPVSNQSVMPPQEIAPQMPVDSLAQSNLAKSQSQLLDAERFTEDLLRNNKLVMSNATIMNAWAENDKIKAETNFTEEETRNLVRLSNQIDATCKEISARTSLIESQTKGQDISNQYAPSLSRAQYHRLVQDTATSAAQASFLMANKENIEALAFGQRQQNKLFHDTYQNRVHLLQYEDETKKAGISIARTSRDMFTFKLGQCKTYDDYHQMLELGNSAMDLIKKVQDSNPIERQMETGRKTLGTFVSPSVSANPFDSGF